MRVAHFDCFSGVSGDMTVAALLDAGVDRAPLDDALASLGLPVRLRVERVQRAGFAATHVTMDADDQSSHRHLPEIEDLLAKARVTPRQRDLAVRVFRRLAEAEAAAHGMPVDRVHFHEVGALDSIADILCASVGLDLLGVDRFSSRSVPTGTGSVKCAHGLMPVPTPATARLLAGAPLASSDLRVELTTPTGAAILTSVVTQWVESPALTAERVGMGAGTKDFPDRPNVLRLFVGTAPDAPSPQGVETDTVEVLETNLDDVPGEVVGYCRERLFAAGALDVFTVPVQMKKDRPGVLLTVLAPPDRADALELVLFRETATFGVRRHTARRRKLVREPATAQTPFGPVQGKRGRGPGGLEVFTPEYEDCARVAREHGVPLREVYDAVRRAGG